MFGNRLVAACSLFLPGIGLMAALNTENVVAGIKSYESHALRHAGDPNEGKTLFFDNAQLRCANCHQVDGQGSEVGPDLSRIGNKFDRPHLIQSMLQPSAQIVEGYRAVVVETIDGKVLSGVVRSEDRQSLMIANDKQKQVISRAQVESIHDSPLSLMPDNVHQILEKQQFTDLVAYLETLRSAGRGSPGSGTSGAIALSDGFELTVLATGLNAVTAIDVLDNRRILVCEQTGALRLIEDGELRKKPVLRVPVDSLWERGLIGVTVAPDFVDNPAIYVCYVANQPYPHHHVSRFPVSADLTNVGDEQVLLVGDNQQLLGGNVPAGHQGGGIHFGNDGKLYVAIGEQTAKTPAQSLDSFLGKILRINRDGSIPRDNPLRSKTRGKYQAIWAYGCRNPFTFAIRRSDGLMLINDVGGRFEEINPGVAGANYGWPRIEHGPVSIDETKVDIPDNFVAPMHYYRQASISGGDFLPRKLKTWPRHLRGCYFFADFVHGWIKYLRADRDDARARSFASGLNRPVDLRFAPNGDLYVLLRNAWVRDDKFVEDTGSLLRIRPTP